MKPVSEDLRMRTVSVYEEGEPSFPQVAECFRVGVRSVKRFVRQFRETGNLIPAPAADGSHPVLDESYIQYLPERMPRDGFGMQDTGVNSDE